MNQHVEEIVKYYNDRGLSDGFNFQDLPKGLMYLTSEVAEAFEAWRENDLVELGREFADIAIILLFYSHVTGYDLDEEIQKKMKFNWSARSKGHGKINI